MLRCEDFLNNLKNMSKDIKNPLFGFIRNYFFKSRSCNYTFECTIYSILNLNRMYMLSYISIGCICYPTFE